MRTFKCRICGCSFSEADKSWDVAIKSGQCQECLATLRDFPVSLKLQEGKLAAPLAATLAAAPSLQPSGVSSAPRFCTSCGASTKASARFCTTCGCALNFPVGSNRHEDMPPAHQPKQQEEKIATQQPYPWGTVFTWAFLAFLLGLATARPTWKSATSIDQSVLGVFIGAAYAVITGLIVGGYKYLRRNPSQFLNGCTWTRVTAEEAKKHPLYGVRGWLGGFAFVLVFGFLQEIQPVLLQAFKNVGPTNLLAFDIPIIRAVKFALVIYALAAIIIYWLLFSRHRSFRPVSSCILLGIWPVQALRGILDPSPAVVDALALSFFTYVLHCAILVAYLQRSKRVRVTYEHSVGRK